MFTVLFCMFCCKHGNPKKLLFSKMPVYNHSFSQLFNLRIWYYIHKGCNLIPYPQTHTHTGEKPSNSWNTPHATLKTIQPSQNWIQTLQICNPNGAVSKTLWNKQITIIRMKHCVAIVMNKANNEHRIILNKQTSMLTVIDSKNDPHSKPEK